MPSWLTTVHSGTRSRGCRCSATSPGCWASRAAAAWDGARQLAVSVATEGTSEPNVDPVERMRIEQLARVADLHVANATGLSTSVGGRAVSVLPVNRTRWVMDSLDAYRPLVERLADALGPQEPADADEPEDDADPFSGMFSGMLQMFQPMVLAMTAGSMVGHLAQRTFGQYDLPDPAAAHRAVRRRAAARRAEPRRLRARSGACEPDDLRLWICVHEVAAPRRARRAARARAGSTTSSRATCPSFRNDPSALEERIGEIDLADPVGAGQPAGGDRSPEVILGAITSPEQEALRPRLEAIVAVVVGVVDHVVDVVGGELITDYPMLTEALRRRRVEAAAADRFVERLFGLELTQATYDRGSAFVERRARARGRRRPAPPLGGRRAASPPPPRSTPPASGSPASAS